MNRLIPFTSLVFCLTLIFLTGCESSSTGGSNSSDTNDPVQIDRSDEVYARSRVLDVRIELSPSDWQSLRMQTRSTADLGITPDCMPPDQPIPSPFTWFSAKITVDGEVFENVGIRKKGFIGSLSETKPSFKVRFDKFEDDQDFLDMKRLTLNNCVQDPSLVRQCLAYDLFRSVGVTAPRCNYAHVFMNGQDLGVYANVESIKKPFLRRNFADPEGNLYEGTLSDFRPGWTGTFNQKTNNDEPSKDLIDAIATALTVPDDQLVDELSKVIDFDAFMNFWAIETLTAHWDGYAGNTNNFHIYEDPTSGKVHFIPWGVDQTFSVQYMLFEGQVAPRSINAAGLITRRLYLSPQGQELYINKLLDILDNHWDGQALRASVEEMVATFESSVPVANRVEMNSNVASVLNFVLNQEEAIRAEINPNPQAWTTPLRENLCPGEGSGRGLEWEGSIRLGETSGSFEYRRENDDGVCDMEAELTGLASVENCSEQCNFAMEMTVTTLVVNDQAESTCTEDEFAVTGQTFLFEHSTIQIGEYEETPVYRLYQYKDDAWSTVEGGYSAVFGSNENGYWFFGAKN